MIYQKCTESWLMEVTWLANRKIRVGGYQTAKGLPIIGRRGKSDRKGSR